MPVPRASQALSRFTVLDLTRVRSGPTCVRQLADWGANVIKIETPPHLEKGEGPGGPRENPDFQNLHRNKRSITLDLKSPQGLAAFKRMVEKADVVVENYRPDVKDRLGIDYESLQEDQQAHRPRQHFRLRPGRALSRPPRLRPDRARHGRADVDHRPAGAGAGARRHSDRRSVSRAVLRARHPGGAARARAVGRGPVGLDLAAAGADFHARFPGRALAADGQRWPSRPATITRPRIPTGVFKTKDGYINIAAGGQVMWERVCEAIEAPELVNRPGFDTGARRSKNRDAVNAEIEKRMANKTGAEWIAIFNKVGVPCGPINSIDEVFADPQVKHLGIAQNGKRPDGSERDLRRPAGHAVAHAERDRRSRRPSRASTPTRCSRNSASPPTRSRICTGPRRCDDVSDSREEKDLCNERSDHRPTKCCPARKAASAI